MPIVMVFQIIAAVVGILKVGVLSYVEIKAILAKYKDVPATPETIEKLRLELLEAAQMTDAVDDPRIREILEADGIDPETLRIT